jgi:GNAT superfamily N-acetyltransferase
MQNNYRIETGFDKTDVDFVHRELVVSYWAKNIPYGLVSKAIRNSMCFNVYAGETQVAFARVVTDHATFAYLCDVVVNEAHRGKGIGKMLMKRIMEDPSLQGLRRFMLGTKDAHGLYRQYGFSSPMFPDRLMEILKPDIYSKM